MEWQWHGVMSF
ncbi:hypothetical protein BpHYR1_023974 [Brachionus plicatilis]|uniref:Uncharacterized protein n=1 Tax=Brachionus plicatilis TaxID=10195 RepID=A0A3M7PG06_BRAPC|nr:hypothetical protein BpHYR1_023974 [Brachionus plicatilis]